MLINEIIFSFSWAQRYYQTSNIDRPSRVHMLPFILLVILYTSHALECFNRKHSFCKSEIEVAL